MSELENDANVTIRDNIFTLNPFPHVFKKKFDYYHLYWFEDFLYRMNQEPSWFGLDSLDGGFFVEVVGADADMIKKMYQVSPVAQCDFFNDSYNKFISVDLRSNGNSFDNHAIEIISDSFIWYNKNELWGAYGSRDFGIVILGFDKINSFAAHYLAKEWVEELLDKDIGEIKTKQFIEDLCSTYNVTWNKED